MNLPAGQYILVFTVSAVNAIYYVCWALYLWYAFNHSYC